MTNPMSQIKETFSRIGSLINFSTMVIVFLGLFVAYGVTTANTANAISGLADRIDQVVAKEDGRWLSHADLHKERNGEVKAREGSVDTRLSSLEKSSSDIAAKNDQINYRLTVNEQQTKSVLDALKELTSTINEMKGDIRVIVARGDEAATPKRKP